MGDGYEDKMRLMLEQGWNEKKEKKQTKEKKEMKNKKKLARSFREAASAPEPSIPHYRSDAMPGARRHRHRHRHRRCTARAVTPPPTTAQSAQLPKRQMTTVLLHRRRHRRRREAGGLGAAVTRLCRGPFRPASPPPPTAAAALSAGPAAARSRGRAAAQRNEEWRERQWQGARGAEVSSRGPAAQRSAPQRNPSELWLRMPEQAQQQQAQGAPPPPGAGLRRGFPDLGLSLSAGADPMLKWLQQQQQQQQQQAAGAGPAADAHAHPHPADPAAFAPEGRHQSRSGWRACRQRPRQIKLSSILNPCGGPAGAALSPIPEGVAEGVPRPVWPRAPSSTSSSSSASSRGGDPAAEEALRRLSLTLSASHHLERMTRALGHSCSSSGQGSGASTASTTSSVRDVVEECSYIRSSRKKHALIDPSGRIGFPE
ncbi:Protein of unknown function [Gryllus bimaculatus]|nr:Protein of unknown function [Gryllus bimaculatus]